MEPANPAEVTGAAVFRSDGAYSSGLAGPSQATGYSRRHWGQIYLPWIGHIGWLCIFLHQSCEIMFLII
jgi:hypothetical protein